MITDKPQCCAKVWSSTAWRPIPCAKSGKVQVDGKWYCGTHKKLIALVKRALAHERSDNEISK